MKERLIIFICNINIIIINIIIVLEKLYYMFLDGILIQNSRYNLYKSNKKSQYVSVKHSGQTDERKKIVIHIINFANHG